MLLRAYRFTDKLSLALLKTLLLVTGMMTDGLMLVLSVFGGLLGWLTLILGAIGGVALAILRRLGWLFAAILGVLFGASRRITGGTSRAAGDAMARRAARAQMDVGLAEDPLRAQNRVLSGLVVVVLVALIAVVLWATRPRNEGLPLSVASGGINLNPGVNATADSSAGAGTPSLAIASPIPTATQLPDALAARGAVAFTVRSNGQTDIFGVGVGDSRSPIRLTNHALMERDPAWSPDGRKLAYASNKGGNWDLYIYDLVSGVTEPMTLDLSFQGNPSWSPDGFWLVYESYQGNNLDIYVLAVDGSRPPERLPASSPSADFSPAWSADGRHIAFTSWMDGASQDIYVFSLDTFETINLTQTPDRNEDFAAWYPVADSPNAGLITYSAMDNGLEKVFVKSITDPDAPAQVIGVGREPSWAPNGVSIIAAVDSRDATHLTVYPYNSDGVPLIINAPVGATSPVWTRQPLPAALVNAGGLPDQSRVLYNEQVGRADAPPFYRLNTIGDVDVEQARLSDRVNDSFTAMREKVLAQTGWDFLGRLDDAWWTLDYRPQPGEDFCNWHLTGRAFSVNRAYPLVGFPPQVQVVRQDNPLNTTWRLYVRVVDEAQSGQLGEPLRRLPWDFTSRDSGDVQAYEQGGKLKAEMPQGYFVDFTELAADYGWFGYPATSDWRANSNGINYWMFYKPDGLTWLDAMRELYTDDQLGGCFQPTATPPAAPQVIDTGRTETPTP